MRRVCLGVRAPSLAFLVVSLLNPVVTLVATAQEVPVPGSAARYLLTEEWSVSAQGPVHLREKQVKATYQLEVADQGVALNGNRRLTVHFKQVAVEANIPAQKRKGNFDSQHPPVKLNVEHHELIRPLALWGQTLTFTISPEGTLKEAAGTDGVSRRLDKLYDQFLRGSEQDLHTREIELHQVSAVDLCRRWGDLFVCCNVDRTKVDAAPGRRNEMVVIACIPSESWMKPIEIPVLETVQVTTLSEGNVQIVKSANLTEPKTVRTTIGAVAWRYDPLSAKRESTLQVRRDGRVEKLNSTSTVVLATTLSIGAEVPIQMTIRHATEMSRQ